MFVLVVDDDEDFLLLARRALAARGHDVETTSTAFGLVNRVAGATGRRPDVVLLDCDLPGLKGVSALELLKKDRRTSQTCIVLVSAADTDAHREAARGHPHALFIQKDGHLKRMVERLEQHAQSVVQPALAKS